MAIHMMRTVSDGLRASSGTVASFMVHFFRNRARIGLPQALMQRHGGQTHSIFDLDRIRVKLPHALVRTESDGLRASSGTVASFMVYMPLTGLG